jgi:hypothetical protein
MNDEIVKLEDQLFARTVAEGALEGFAEAESDARHADAEKSLREALPGVVAASPGGTMTFDAVRRALLPEFFGRVKQGSYSRAVKALVKDGRLVREQRQHAKLDGDERLTLPYMDEAPTVSAA